MEWIVQYGMEIFVAAFLLTLGGLGTFQMRQNNKSDEADKEQRRLLDEQRNLMDERHLRALDRMEVNQTEFQKLHLETISSMTEITNKLSSTNQCNTPHPKRIYRR
jgi:Na+/phosphate symporter